VAAAWAATAPKQPVPSPPQAGSRARRSGTRVEGTDPAAGRKQVPPRRCRAVVTVSAAEHFLQLAHSAAQQAQ